MNLQRTLLILSLLALSACSALSNKHLASDAKTLQPCPSSPNCVSSLANDDHFITPLVSPLSGLKSVYNLINQQHGCSVVTMIESYLHAECKSKLFGFIDDVEFIQKHDVIHIRSAARLGYSDLGVNRKRIEVLRGILSEAP